MVNKDCCFALVTSVFGPWARIVRRAPPPPPPPLPSKSGYHFVQGTPGNDISDVTRRNLGRNIVFSAIKI